MDHSITQPPTLKRVTHWQDPFFLPPTHPLCLSWIQILTAKITQVCRDICDIKLRCLLVARSDKEPDNITRKILTNQSDHEDTWGSGKSKPETPDIHEGCAEDENDYIYNTPNHLEHGNWDILQHHDTYQPQWLPGPSEMPPMPLPYSDLSGPLYPKLSTCF